jgi:hypothetical protein
MNRNKTRKASVAPAAPPPPPPPVEEVAVPLVVEPKAEVYGENPNLETFLDTNASEAYRRPWHRLERGLRLNRLRMFILKEKAKLSLSDPDTEYLTNLLQKSLANKLLNSKSAVVYSIEAQEILEIKGLVYHTTSEGRVLSQIVEKKGVTFRKPQH